MDNNQNPLDEAVLKMRIAELERELMLKQLSIDYNKKLLEIAGDYFNVDLEATYREKVLKEIEEEQKKK